MKLRGRVALVTGASGGIGRSIAIALAAEGAVVAANYHENGDAAEDVVGAIAAAGGKAIAVQADVGDYAQVENMVERVVGELGSLDILVNNAGLAKDGLIFDMDPGAWLDVMRTNFGGVIHCTRASLEHLMAGDGGSIVNVSSALADRAWLGDSLYAASKAAVSSFTRGSALELARFGVRVNAVLPGFVPTALVHGIMARDGGKGVLPSIPMRAWGRPEDVANTVVFLAGPEASYMTGSLVTVDGGTSILLGLGRSQ